MIHVVHFQKVASIYPYCELVANRGQVSTDAAKRLGGMRRWAAIEHRARRIHINRLLCSLVRSLRLHVSAERAQLHLLQLLRWWIVCVLRRIYNQRHLPGRMLALVGKDACDGF